MIDPHSQFGGAHTGRRIGLLGGSFNPAHAGHLAMSLFALKRLGLDEVWWLVSPQNPLKPVTGMAALGERMKAARKMASHPRIVVTDIEQGLKTRYTVDTLRALKRRYPKARFVWLMGADNFEQIPRWRNWTRIFAEVPVAIFRRDGHAAGRGRGHAANRFGNGWRDVRKSRELALMTPPSWLVLDNPLNLLSATAIRRHQSR